MSFITEERDKLKAVGLVLIRREAWGSTFDYTEARKVDHPATEQFIHITVTNPDNYSSDAAHARAVEAIGKSRFPQTGGSYNRMHFRSGKAMELQPILRRGAHTVNDDQRSTCNTTGCPSKGQSVGHPSVAWNLNYSARAYVICQNIDDSVTPTQLDALARSMAGDRLAGFVTKTARIHGHRCVSSKSCPGDKMWAFMQTLKNKVNFYVTNGLEGDEVGTIDPTAANKDVIADAVVEAFDRVVPLRSGGVKRFYEQFGNTPSESSRLLLERAYHQTAVVNDAGDVLSDGPMVTLMEEIDKRIRASVAASAQATDAKLNEILKRLPVATPTP